jgi:hypothetical protein
MLIRGYLTRLSPSFPLWLKSVPEGSSAPARVQWFQENMLLAFRGKFVTQAEMVQLHTSTSYLGCRFDMAHPPSGFSRRFP